MKKLALILAVVFTMGLTASTVTAAPKDKTPKKTEQKSEKKEDCAKAKECPAATKKACCGDKK
jgi:hypothetical protein